MHLFLLQHLLDTSSTTSRCRRQNRSLFSCPSTASLKERFCRRQRWLTCTTIALQVNKKKRAPWCDSGCSEGAPSGGFCFFFSYILVELYSKPVLSTDISTFPRSGEKARCRMLEETTTHRSSDEGRRSTYLRETFLAVAYTNVSYPYGREWAGSFLRSASKSIAVKSGARGSGGTLQVSCHLRAHSDASRCRSKKATCPPTPIRMRHAYVGVTAKKVSREYAVWQPTPEVGCMCGRLALCGGGKLR